MLAVFVPKLLSSPIKLLCSKTIIRSVEEAVMIVTSVITIIMSMTLVSNNPSHENNPGSSSSIVEMVLSCGKAL